MKESKPLEVLVIDDSELALELMCDVLEQAGIGVIGLPSAIGATSVVLRERIKVVVSDVIMPGLTGSSIATLFAKNPKTSHVKLVLVSELPQSELLALSAQNGVSSVLPKSKVEQELPRLVQRLLRTARLPREASA